MCSEDFWEFCNTNGLGRYGDYITSKEKLIDVNRALWFILGRSMRKNHRTCLMGGNYVRNNIQKHFKMGILEYSERVRGMFEMAKIPPPLIRKNKD